MIGHTHASICVLSKLKKKITNNTCVYTSIENRINSATIRLLEWNKYILENPNQKLNE